MTDYVGSSSSPMVRERERKRERERERTNERREDEF